MRKAIAPSCIDLGIVLGFREQRDFGVGRIGSAFDSIDPHGESKSTLHDPMMVSASQRGFGHQFHDQSHMGRASSAGGNQKAHNLRELKKGGSARYGYSNGQLVPEDGAGWGVPNRDQNISSNSGMSGLSGEPVNPRAS